MASGMAGGKPEVKGERRGSGQPGVQEVTECKLCQPSDQKGTEDQRNNSRGAAV